MSSGLQHAQSKLVGLNLEEAMTTEKMLASLSAVMQDGEDLSHGACGGVVTHGSCCTHRNNGKLLGQAATVRPSFQSP